MMIIKSTVGAATSAAVGSSIWIFLWLLFSTVVMITVTVESRSLLDEYASDFLSASADSNGTKWAVLVAGSNEYYNYRHQADVCHAYQIMKNGGLKDENIIVFMFDDIAYNEENPTPGLIVNKPYGPDVYRGVPKDYTGNNTTAHNLYNVLLGKEEALTGGSGKVLKSGPDDLVFFFYADHGSVGFVCMPVGDYVYAKKLNKVLERMHRDNMYKKMVIYIEACESGSMMSGLLSDQLNVYSTTASNPNESSWATYCPGSAPTNHTTPGSPEYYGSCLGDLYSISWLEDSDVNDLKNETLDHQYEAVKKRTNESHVMQYGDMELSNDFLSTFMGSNPNNSKLLDPKTTKMDFSNNYLSTRSVNQRDAQLVYLKHKIQRAPVGSPERVEAEKILEDEMSHREQVDLVMEKIVKALSLFNDGESAQTTLSSSLNVRPEGQPVVDDWECFKTMVDTYQMQCGAMSHYAKKYAGLLANLCNAGVGTDLFAHISTQACSSSN